MIGLWCKDNGQWLQCVLAPRSASCTPDHASALQFATVEDAESFLRVSGLGQYFEPRSLVRAAAPLRAKGKRRRAV
ncbi:hypothetical protein AMST5_00056 [freshwater sediment metagenome]|uniref:Uncharacterized protein n=1 Tax=freshwater sediment metagenome TaxID=556182 RepID=A0AA48LXC0_9ZZZZ